MSAPGLPRWRLGIALAVIAYAAAMRRWIGPCEAMASAALVVLPVAAVLGLVALVSLVRAVVRVARRAHRPAQAELLIALLMLAAMPVSIAVNVAMDDVCANEDAR